VIGYLDWAQNVLRVVLRERPANMPLTMGKLAADLGLPFDERSDAQRNEVILALDHVLSDLVPRGVVQYESEGFTIDYPRTARRFRVEPLSSMFPLIRSGYLEAEDEAFLAALARLSERPGIEHADVAGVGAEEVFAALGWDWDGPRAVTVYGNLHEQGLVEGSMFPGYSIAARVTYAGLARALPTATPDPQSPPTRRARGRPKGSRAVTRDQIVITFGQLRTQYGRPPTQAELCRQLEPRIEVRTLRDALDAYGLFWPIE
jgi:hypothetical protein